MKRYDSYKDSGIQWIGEIPSHWDVCAFKRFMTINNGSDYKHIVSDEGFPVIGSGGPFATASQYMYDGEVVMLGRKGTIDKPMYFNGKFWAVDTMFYAIPSKEANCRFMYYLALTFPFNYYSTATALPSMTQTDLGNNPVAVPDLAEQSAIATYLDNKCSKIDNVIATQEKRVELLRELKQSIITRAVTHGINPDAKMKDSGVEWIGEIPEHWEVQRIKHIVKQIGDVDHYMPKSVETGIPYVMTGDLQEKTSLIDFESCKQISGLDYLALSKKIKAEIDDIIFARYATIGTTCYVDIEKEFIVSYSCVTIKPNKNKTNGKYLIYYIKSNAFAEEVQSYINSNTQGNVGVESLNSTRLALPPIKEQQQIVTYIEQQTSRLDFSITKALRQIELLKEYKQSLITEVVTGKRKVC